MGRTNLHSFGKMGSLHTKKRTRLTKPRTGSETKGRPQDFNPFTQTRLIPLITARQILVSTYKAKTYTRSQLYVGKRP